MTLKKYRSKRQTNTSKEPVGKKNKGKKKSLLTFVIQKHAARRLHYDFRLELEGILKSWAIPKGPSLDPKVKRLAIEVEDHPFEYGKFEGTIPRGHYGAGKVEIWDKGTYEPKNQEGNPEKVVKEELKKGELKFILSGKKIKGEYVLVKINKDTEKNQWLLIKKEDDFSTEKEIIEDSSSEAGKIKKKRIRADPMPQDITPMLSTLVKEPFNDPDWIFEVKWDGYRAVAEVTRKKILLYSRNLKSFNEQFPEIVHELEKFKKEDIILDGEVVVVDEKGTPSFQLLQQFLKTGKGNIRYYIFDLLYFDGQDLRDLPLLERKKQLAELLNKIESPALFYSDHVEEKGISFFKTAVKLGLEGIMAKKKDSAYFSKRTNEWLKIKTHKSQEAIIVGFTEPKGSRKNIGSLILGVYKTDQLEFVGHVGTGFDEQALKDIYNKLKKQTTQKCPFKKKPATNTPATWVKPTIVCEVTFTEWTDDGIMRHPVFKGIRIDKSPKEVKMETPKDQTKVKPQSTSKQKNKHKDFLTNQNKIYWPKEKYTKGDLINYYTSISKYILPYLKDRPQVMHRFPEGIRGHDFYHKEAPDFIPDWMETTPVQHTDKVVNYLMISDLPSLLYVVNLGCIELHPFLSRVQHLENPDYFVLDLDPESISFKHVVEVAKTVRETLEEIGAPSYCKTSGKRGIHVYVPVGAKYTYEQAQDLAELVARVVHQRLPKITSLVRNPEKRQKKVYIDFLQNSRSKTVVAPYSVRPAPKATISTPLDWSEVDSKLDPTDFTINTIPKRLKIKGDLFSKIQRQKINLPSILSKLEKLLE